MNMSIKTKPRTYAKVVKYKVWRDALEAEINVLEVNNTWKLVTLPVGKKGQLAAKRYLKSNTSQIEQWRGISLD